MSSGPLSILCFALALSGGPAVAETQVYTLLYSAPNPGSQGAAPVAMFEAAPGLFYFLSAAQGSSAGGPTYGPSILALTPANAGAPKLIYSFPFQSLTENLVQAANGRLYGDVFVALKGSYYYSVSASGQGLQQYPRGDADSLWTMTPGPEGVYDSFGAATPPGGEAYAIVLLNPGGTVTRLHQFSASDGVPVGGNKLVLAADGSIYGIGSQANGGFPPFFIFRLTQSGGYSKLLTFPPEYGGESVSLTAATDGNLYGTFSAYGANGTGVIYQATLEGKLQAVASFPSKGADEGMSVPNSLVEASDYALYGSTVHNAIFRYDPATHALTDAYQMNRYNLQGLCSPCRLFQGMDGKLYGSATIGGPGGGALFSLDFGLPRPTGLV